MKPLKLSATSLLLFFLSLSAPIFAQSDRGNVRGTVTDPNGAVVTNARVVLTSRETNQTRETTSTSDGTYTFNEVPAGAYTVAIEAQGFQRTVTEPFNVAVQATHSVNVQLQVGTATGGEVTVQAEGETLNAENPVRQTNITEQQVKELPLQVGAEFGGRTPLSFIFLDSSVSSADPGGGTNASRFRVSGGQAAGTQILIDGASTLRTQNGNFFSEVAPGPNAYREFTLSTSSYSAEYGQSSGGIVNFTLKSGANQFHGEAYDLLRNEKLNANSLYNKANPTGLLPRNRDNQNDFGFNLGGPIPFLGFGEGVPLFKLYKDRAFFFFNYEGYRFKRGTNATLTVPTLKMRTGDFSELLTDPYVVQFFGRGVQVYDPRCSPATRPAIPGNRLDLVSGPAPAGCIQRPLLDPAGLAILQRYPSPTRGGVFNNYDTSLVMPLDMNQYTFKTDFVLTSKQRLTVSNAWRKNTRLAGANLVLPLPFANQDTWQQAFKSDYLRVQHDYNISANILNHFNFGYTFLDVRNANTTEGFDTSSLGIPVTATQNVAFPRIGFPGYGANDPRNVQNIGSSFFTDRIKDKPIEVSDSVSWVRGKHSLKFGGLWRWGVFNVFQKIDPGGSFNFRHDQTASDADGNGGWPVASLITGATEFAFNSNNSINPRFREFTQAYFVQDDYKLTRKLTLNIGLRYDLPGLRYEENNQYRSFEPDVPNPQAGGRLGAIVGAGGQSGLQAEHRTLARQDKSNWGPRVGAAYMWNNKTVIRAGAGLYYAPILIGTEGGGDINSGTIGYNTTGQLFTPAGRQSTTFLSTFPNVPPVDPNSQFVGNTGVGILQFGNDFRTGRTFQWSIDVQRELPWNFVVDVGYVGNTADRLRSNFERINSLTPSQLRLGAAILNTNINNVTPQMRTYASGIGVAIPASANSVFPGFNGSVGQAILPFPQYGRITNILESQGRSRYNALQIKLERRFAQGIQFGAQYTFSKLLTNASEDILGGGPQSGVLQNPYNRTGLFTVSPTNSPHVFVTNFLAELPIGKGKRFLNHGGVANIFLGGWEVTGIFRYQAGTPLVISLPETQGFLTLAGYYGNLRPNLSGQPLTITRTAVPGVAGRFFVLNRAAFSAPTNFFAGPAFTGSNTSAYAAYYNDPNVFFGNAPAVITDLRSPYFFDENMSILKKTRITETIALELGAEFFNVFNRVRYLTPDVSLGANFSNSNFGAIGAADTPRVIQLRARIIF